jgi:hypothetical protein
MQAQDTEFQTNVCIISSLTETMNDSFSSYMIEMVISPRKFDLSFC